MNKFKNKVRKVFQKINIDIKHFYPQLTDIGLINTVIESLKVDLVLDVGANSGQFAIELRQAGYKNKIVSFEPLTDAYSKLLKNAKNDSDWFVHDRCAIGDYDGIAEINISGNSVSSSILPMLQKHIRAAPSSNFLGREQIKIFKLDTVVDDYLTDLKKVFLKIDTQGFEWKVLNGAATTLTRVDGLLIELSLTNLYEGQHLWLDVIQRMADLGFILWTILPGFTDGKTAQTLQVDAIFVRNNTIESVNI
jgi:FkbM family methyltransferase